MSSYAPKEQYDAVEIVLRSGCYQRHPFEETKTFPNTVTLGEVCEWLRERVNRRYMADPCPGDRLEDGEAVCEHRMEY